MLNVNEIRLAIDNELQSKSSELRGSSIVRVPNFGTFALKKMRCESGICIGKIEISNDPKLPSYTKKWKTDFIDDTNTERQIWIPDPNNNGNYLRKVEIESTNRSNIGLAAWDDLRNKLTSPIDFEEPLECPEELIKISSQLLRLVGIGILETT
jgi:hypothetical protein